MTGLTLGVIDSGWTSRTGCGAALGDASTHQGNPAKPFFPEPGAAGSERGGHMNLIIATLLEHKASVRS